MKKFKMVKWWLAIMVVLLETSTFAQDPNFHIYLCFGQSNMAGAGTIEQQDKTVDSRFQMMQPMDCTDLNRSYGEWYDAVPPLWGCSNNGGLGPADYFGRTMVENLPENIKVGVIVVAIPGCDIGIYFKNGNQNFDTYKQVPQKYEGNAYAWLLEMAKKAQNDGVIKGFLLHQGETNTGQQDWPNKVKGVYDNLISDLGLDASETPLLAGELLYQNHGGACWSHNSVIANLPNVISNSYVISAQDLPGKDQYHFTTEGNRMFGVRYAEQMLSLIPAGISPVAIITEPEDNSSFTTLQTITLAADASDEDGSVARVEFYNDTTLLGTDSTAPYQFQWSGMDAGSHSITARAIDDQGNSGTSEAVTVTCEMYQGPYGDSAHQIPGRIEGEEYDLGGEGAGYHEKNDSGNEGLADLRNDQVDIETTQDTTGSYNICHVLQGEWLEYTVNVSKTGTYTLDLRVAADGDGKSIHIEIDEVNISGDISIPNTGDWQNWTTVSVNDVDLTEGQHVVRIAFDSDYINFNFMEFHETTSIAKHNISADKSIRQCPFSADGLKIKQKGAFKYYITSLNGSVIERGNGMDKMTIGENLIPGIYVVFIENSRKNVSRKVFKYRR